MSETTAESTVKGTVVAPHRTYCSEMYGRNVRNHRRIYGDFTAVYAVHCRHNSKITEVPPVIAPQYVQLTALQYIELSTAVCTVTVRTAVANFRKGHRF